MKKIFISLFACLLGGMASAGPALSTVQPRVSPDLFVTIPGGSYERGDGSGGALGAPRQTVSMSAFSMQRTLVTKYQWDEVRAWALSQGGYPQTWQKPNLRTRPVVDASGKRTVIAEPIPGSFHTAVNLGEGWRLGQGTNSPVSHVKWYEVVKWCNAASERDGLKPCYTVNGAVYRSGESDDVVCDWNANGYRLPTELEWEVAARGGLKGKLFPWGDTVSHSQANYYSHPFYSYDVSPTRKFHPSFGAPSPVGYFPSNGYGLYDMFGNMTQWCWDFWGAYTNEADTRGPLTNPFPRMNRVYRGAAFNSWASASVAFRGKQHPMMKTVIGFRLARSTK